ncbi:MAG: hypothetical protein WD010_09110, partial [Nitriliruptor sp.]
FLAGSVPVLVALAAVTLLLPGDAPRLAQLLPWPLLFLTVEAVAIATRGDRYLAVLTARVAAVTELLVALALPAALGTVATATRDLLELVGFGAVSGARPDLVLATVAGLTALGWAVVVARRVATDAAVSADPTPAATSPSSPFEAPPVGTSSTGREAARDAAFVASATFLAAACTLALPWSGIGVAVLLVTVALTTTVRVGGLRGLVASATALALGATAILGGWAVASLDMARSDAVVGTVVAVLATAVAVVLIVRTERHAAVGEAPAAIVLLPAALAALLVTAAATSEAHGSATALLVFGLLLASLPALLPTLPLPADLLRVLAVASVVFWPHGAFDLDGAVEAALATSVVGAVVALEAIRRRRLHLLIVAGPVLVRAAAGVAFAATDSRPWTGAVLLAAAIAAAAAATFRDELRVAGAVIAVVALVPAIVLLAVTPTALAWGTLAVGLTVVAGGLVARRHLVAHVGGVVTIAGVWQLLAIAEVDAVDAWLAAPALHLWAAAVGPRRAGRLSSWTADVPPLLLVAVPALLERLAGGSGWHTAAAGVLALIAVVGGGIGRHGGPLVVGVVLTVAVVGIETLAVVAAVPTWVWLTVGGVILLGAGALIERTGGAPVAGARRLVEDLTERFD